MPTVTFVNEKKSIEVPPGANLRREAMRSGVEIYSGIHRVLNCQGNGTCASCMVAIKKGEENLSRPGWWEKLRFWLGPMTFLTRLSYDKPLRLACRVRVNGDVEVETHPGVNWHGENFWS